MRIYSLDESKVRGSLTWELLGENLSLTGQIQSQELTKLGVIGLIETFFLLESQ